MFAHTARVVCFLLVFIFFVYLTFNILVMPAEFCGFLKGVCRSIAALIGSHNPETYKLLVSVATIGIRS